MRKHIAMPLATSKLCYTRASVKKSSRGLKFSRKVLGTGQDVQIMDHSTAAQIEEILAQAAIAGASPLPPTNMSKRMLNGDPFAQFGTSFRRLLAVA